MRRLIGQSATSALIRGLGMAASLAVSMVMARALAPEGYGTYSYVLSIVALLSIPATFGLPFLVVRETATAVADRDHGLIWALWLWAQKFVLLAAVPILLGLVAWVALTPGDGTAVEHAWLWGGLLVPILSLASLRAAAVRGLGYTLTSQVPETVLRPALVAGLVLGYLALSGGELSPDDALLINLSGTAIAFIVGGALLVYLAPPRPPRSTWSSHSTRHRTWLISSMTLGLALGAQTIGSNMDLLLLGFMKTKEDVGLYKVALNGGSLVAFALQAMNMVLMPQLAKLYHEANLNELQDLVRSAARLVTFATLTICIGLGVGGETLLRTLFGQGFVGAYWTLLIIGLGQLASALFGSVMLVVSMSGNEKYSLRGTMMFAILNLALNLVLIPLAGKEGAAAATSLSLIVLNFYLWRVAWHKAQINTFAFGSVRSETGNIN